MRFRGRSRPAHRRRSGSNSTPRTRRRRILDRVHTRYMSRSGSSRRGGIAPPRGTRTAPNNYRSCVPGYRCTCRSCTAVFSCRAHPPCAWRRASPLLPRPQTPHRDQAPRAGGSGYGVIGWWSASEPGHRSAQHPRQNLQSRRRTAVEARRQDGAESPTSIVVLLERRIDPLATLSTP
jgi:hypothetical protein